MEINKDVGGPSETRVPPTTGQDFLQKTLPPLIRPAAGLAIDELGTKSLRSLALASGKWQGYIVGLLFVAFPFLNLFNPSQFMIHALVHGFFAFAVVGLGAFLGHLAFLFLRGNTSKLELTKKIAVYTLIADLGATVSGNWIYMPYRGQHGAKERLLATSPALHTVVMEFKEFASLFPLPLLVVALFLFGYYKTDLNKNKEVTYLIGLLLMLSWLYTIISMALGLGISKVQFV